MDSISKEEVYGFGDKLKLSRRKTNLSQKEVASRLNVHPKTISAYENNRATPSLENLVELALLYNVSIDFLLGLSNRKSIFIDDLPRDKQNLLLGIVDLMRNS